MEKLYEADICKIKLINEECGLSQHVKEIILEKIPCIKVENYYININTNEKYLYLKNDFNHIITCDSELAPFLETQNFAINVSLYEEDLSKKDVAINYLKAIKTRKTLEEQERFHNEKRKVKMR